MMKPELTTQQKEAYLKSGVRCPFCLSPDLSGDEFDLCYAVVEQQVQCLSCGAGWTDVYTLTGLRVDFPPRG